MIKIFIFVGIFSFFVMLIENIINCVENNKYTSSIIKSETIVLEWSGFTGDLLVSVKEKSGLSWKMIATRMGISDTKLRKFKNPRKYTPIPFFDAIMFCIACDLDYYSTLFFLNACNYTLCDHSLRDQIIRVIISTPTINVVERTLKIDCIKILKKHNVFNYNSFEYKKVLEDYLLLDKR